MKKLVTAFVIVLAIAAVASGALALLTASTPPAYAGKCLCPLYCLPVVCSNGKTYCNTCLAACAGAKNCVPEGPGPIPL